jgi:hypothetical protein
MDLDDIKIGWLYRYKIRSTVRVVALLPGGPSQDDPDGPQSADMIMVTYHDDDHQWYAEPEDLAPLDLDEAPEGAECPKCGQQSRFRGDVVWCPCSGWL